MDRKYNINNKEDLMSIITQVSFALDDIKLYLDTHPCDEEASGADRAYCTGSDHKQHECQYL